MAGEPVAAIDLPDGYRSCMAWMADLCAAWAALEPDRARGGDPATVSLTARASSGVLIITGGVEITSSFSGGDVPYSSGHLNAYPVRPDPTAYRGGAPVFEGRRLRDALAADLATLDWNAYVARRFAAETGLTFGAWRRRARLLAAIERLAGGEAVTVVALEAGYDSVSAFIHAFRRDLGVTPGRYFGS